MSLLLILSAALAADNFDAHGFRLGALNDDPVTPLQMSLPAAWQPKSFAVGGVLEYAESPLVRIYGNGTVQPVLDNVVALNLSGSYSPISRVRIHASVPLYLASRDDFGSNGVDLGDLRVSGDAVLLEGPLSVGVNPFIDLPTGANGENLGQGGLAGGGLLTGRLLVGPMAFGAAFGPYFRPDITDLENLQGADRLLTGVHVGVRATEALGINAELRAESPFSKNPEVGTDTPVELLLHGRYRLDSGAHFLVGGSSSLSQGASAANFRIFVGGGFGNYVQPQPPPLGTLAVAVRLDDQVVPGAEVRIEEPELEEFTSRSEAVMLEERTPGEMYKATATYGSCHAGEARAMVPDGGIAAMPIDLELLDAQVRVEVYNQDDEPVPNATVTWESDATRCVPGDALVLADTNVGTQSVGVGTHSVLVTAPDHSPYTETVEIVEDEDKLIRAVLKKTRVVVKREKIEILEKVFFAFDGDEIDPKSGPLLDEVAGILNDHPEILSVEVGGHTDWEGDDAYNMDLSQRRVDAVRQWLIDKGVSEDRLVAKGYGESEPIAENTTDAGRAKNRRVEFNILERDESVEVEEVRIIEEAPEGTPDEAVPEAPPADEDGEAAPTEEEATPEEAAPTEEEAAPIEEEAAPSEEPGTAEPAEEVDLLDAPEPEGIDLLEDPELEPEPEGNERIDAPEPEGDDLLDDSAPEPVPLGEEEVEAPSSEEMDLLKERVGAPDDTDAPLDDAGDDLPEDAAPE